MVNITIRHVPEDVRDEVARRAALRGQSAQEFLLSLLVTLSAKPDRDEVLARAAALRQRIPPIDVQTLLERDSDGRY